MRPNRPTWRASGGQRDVGRDRQGEDEPELPSVLGRVRDPPPDRVVGRSDAHLRPVDPDRARVCRGDAEQGQADVGPPRADQAGEAEHLPRAQLEADILERSSAPESLDLEDDLPGRGRRSLEEVAERPADHLADRRRRRGIRPGPGRDPAAVAQDRDPVRDLEDLLHPVRDEEDRHALLAQRVHDAEEAAHLVGRQRRGRLVHDQGPHPEREGLGDLDGLLLGQRQPSSGLVDVEPDPQAIEDRLWRRGAWRDGRRSGHGRGG